MNVTELLITAYEGDKVVYVTSVSPDSANTVVTSTDGAGETIVDSATERSAPAFVEFVRLLEELRTAP